MATYTDNSRQGSGASGDDRFNRNVLPNNNPQTAYPDYGNLNSTTLPHNRRGNPSKVPSEFQNITLVEGNVTIHARPVALNPKLEGGYDD